MTKHKCRPLLILFADIAALLLAYFLSDYAADFISGILTPSNTKHLITSDEQYLFFLLSLVAIFLFYNFGHYTRRIPWWSQVHHTMAVFICLMMTSGFLHFAMHYSFQRLPALLFWLFAWMLLLLMRQFAHIIGRTLKIWSIPTAVVGDGENAIDAIYALCSDRHPGYDISALLLYSDFKGFSKDILPLSIRDIEIITGPENCVRFISNHLENFYVLAPEAMQHIDGEKLTAMISELCGRENYAIVPPTKGLALYGQVPDFFFGYDIMLFHPLARINYPYKRVVKRAMDIVFASLLLVVFCPVIIIIMLLMVMEGGDIFFPSERIGYRGKIFKCWKFRTMRPNSQKILNEALKDPKARVEWEKDFKLHRDPRVTRLGVFLRKSSFDELPQLFNILKGDMSLVGPRPILAGPRPIIGSEKEKYGDKFPVYISVKPGVTGLWQVNGRSDVSFKYRIYLDSWYIENWSIWYDVVILIKTVLVILRRSGAY